MWIQVSFCHCGFALIWHSKYTSSPSFISSEFKLDPSLKLTIGGSKYEKKRRNFFISQKQFFLQPRFFPGSPSVENSQKRDRIVKKSIRSEIVSIFYDNGHSYVQRCMYWYKRRWNYSHTTSIRLLVSR